MSSLDFVCVCTEVHAHPAIHSLTHPYLSKQKNESLNPSRSPETPLSSPTTSWSQLPWLPKPRVDEDVRLGSRPAFLLPAWLAQKRKSVNSPVGNWVHPDLGLSY